MFKKLKSFVPVLAVLAALSLVSCNSRNTSDNESADLDTIFVGDESNTGSLEIILDTNSVGVADTTGFLVTARGVNGQPVQNARITCDTEGDLALIEPSSGSFLTSSSGAASGVIGCQDAGSFRMGCRLGGGGAARTFIGVNCTGTRPVGFTGFPGAGGGGLGNGVADIGDDEDVNDDEFTVRLTSVQFTDGGDVNTSSIDLFGDPDCDNDINGPTIDPEPFTDSSVQFNISNNTETTVRFTSYRYTVNNFNGAGSTIMSSEIALIGESVANGQSGSFTGLLFFANNGVKFINGSGGPQITAEGFKNIDFTLNGILANGDPVTIEASQAASFNDFDRC